MDKDMDKTAVKVS